MSLRWMPYDPEWLVELAEKQLPSETWLHEALARCTTRLIPDSGEFAEDYIAFVERERASDPESEWGFKRNVVLKHPNGDIVLDILRNNSVGGMEQQRRFESQGCDSICPVCGATLIQEKCKVVCRSDQCRYRIIFNYSEF